MPNLEPGHDASSTAERVIASAVELTRAEAGLAMTRARVLLVKIATVLLAVMLTASAAQVSLVLVALSPVLFEAKGWPALLLALVPSLALTGLGARVALTAWRAFRSAAGPFAARGES
jgi:hypothetical protein